LLISLRNENFYVIGAKLAVHTDTENEENISFQQTLILFSISFNFAVFTVLLVGSM